MDGWTHHVVRKRLIQRPTRMPTLQRGWRQVGGEACEELYGARQAHSGRGYYHVLSASG